MIAASLGYSSEPAPVRGPQHIGAKAGDVEQKVEPLPLSGDAATAKRAGFNRCRKVFGGIECERIGGSFFGHPARLSVTLADDPTNADSMTYSAISYTMPSREAQLAAGAWLESKGWDTDHGGRATVYRRRNSPLRIKDMSRYVEGTTSFEVSEEAPEAIAGYFAVKDRIASKATAP